MINVAKWALLALLALPFLELAVFVAVAAMIGFGWALSLVVAGSAIGLVILRRAGGSHIARMRVALDQGSFTALQADASGGATPPSRISAALAKCTWWIQRWAIQPSAPGNTRCPATPTSR